MKSLPILSTLFLLLSALHLSAQEIQPHQIVPYKIIPGSDLHLHFFFRNQIPPETPHPTILFFFGGGWKGGHPKQFYPQSQYLASRGMVAVCAEYRTESSHQTTPIECVKDGKSAIRWLRQHHQKFGIDPQRLVVGGGSAGGHVAAATATPTSFTSECGPNLPSCMPDALILFNPVVDNGPKGYGYQRVQPYWKEISPFHILDKSFPPTLFLLGTNDRLIPVQTAQTFQANLQNLGVRCDLILYDGQPHGFFNTARYQETLKAADQFLTSLGYLAPLP